MRGFFSKLFHTRRFGPHRQRGFTILFAVIVITLLVSIATSIVSITTREVKISSTGQHSVSARYAAESGRECLLYWLYRDSNELGGDTSLSETCGASISIAAGSYTVGGNDYEYKLDVDYGVGGCAEVYYNRTEGTYRSDGFNSCGTKVAQRSIVGANINATATGGGGAPLPQCESFTATPSSIVSGNSATLDWSTSNATAVSINQGIGTVAQNGSTNVSPTVTTSYTLTASDGSDSDDCSVTVTVTGTPPGAPTCTSFSATSPIDEGNDTTLTWNTSDADTVTLSGAVDGVIGNVTPVNGGSITHTINASQTFTMEATNSNGFCQLQDSVVMNPATNPDDGPTNGLVLWWKLEDGSGGTASDSSGSGNTGSVSGASWSTDSKVGSGALSFDGINDQVRGNSSLAQSGNFTMSMFVKSDSVGSEYTGIFSSEDASASVNNFQIDYGGSGNGCSGEFRFYRVGSEPRLCIGAVGVGAWAHLVVTYDGTTIRTYRDGAPDDQVVDAFGGNFANILVGTNRAKSLFHDGIVDDVRIYNRALSATEIGDLYALGSGGGTPTPPTCTSFTVTPSSVSSGNSVTLAWDTGDSDTVSINQGVGSVAVPDGSTSDTPATSQTYTLTASNTGGSCTMDASVTVTTPPPPTPPTCDSFTVSPSSVSSGNSVTLEWDTTDSDSVSINQGVGSVTAPDGSTSDTPGSSRTYTLTATNADGSCTADASVTVTANEGPTNGLAGWWKFEEGSGSTAADSSGEGNNGSISGASWTTSSKVGTGALSFDGNDVVEIPYDASLDLTDSGTIAAWVYSTVHNEHNIIYSTRSYGQNSGFWLKYFWQDLQFTVSNGSGGNTNKYSTDSNLAPINQWNHVAAVFDDTANTVRFFINGSFINQVSGSYDILSSSRGVRIGLGYFSEGFKGRIDDVRVYNRALSDGEIGDLYDATNN